MWVNRLVAEGYRSDELPKIDYCIISGGPYDMYAHYQYLAEENTTQYPVALPLILSGMIDASGNKVTNEEIFNDDLVQYLPELFDSKQHDTDYINSFIYKTYGNANDKSLPIDKIVKPAFFDEESEPMKEIVYQLKQNSLVYDTRVPDRTDRITFIHSKKDEVVPFLNQESMERHLTANGYSTFDIDDSPEEKHTDTGTYYVLKAITNLSTFTPTGMEDMFSNIPAENTYDIYNTDGRLVCRKTTLSEALRTLPKGIYVINGKKIAK